MRLAIFLVGISLLSIAPAATAGPDAGIEVLEASNECTPSSTYEGGSTSWPGGYSSWYSSTQSLECADSLTYAGVHVSDDAGTIASAQAGAWNGTTSSSSSASSWGSWSSNSSYDYWDSYESSQGATDAWTRRVQAEALGTTAGAQRGCASEHASNYGASYGAHSSSNDWGEWQSAHSQSSSEHAASAGCATGVDASHAGRSQSASYGNRCEWESTDRSSSDRYSQRDVSGYEQSGTNERRSRTDSNACRDGVTLGGASGAAFAGSENRCESAFESENSTYTSSGGPSYASGHSRQSEACSEGYVVEGPDGIRLFLGERSSSWEDCSTYGGCYGEAGSFEGAEMQWNHNPLGPDANPSIATPFAGNEPTLP